MVSLSDTDDISEQVTQRSTALYIRLWPWALTVVSLAAMLFFLRLGERGLWGPEGRWGSIAREMQLSSNYFWPTINGNVYYDKPLLSYWFVLAASRLTDGVNETATRLASAASGLAGVAILIILAIRLYDRRTAVLAGFVLATSYSYVFWARVASADMETVTGTLAAVTLFVFRRERKSKWWVVGLWFIMAVTSLTKGLVGFAVPLVVIGCYSFLSEGWREFLNGMFRGSLTGRITWLTARSRWFFNWKTLLAVLLAGTVYYLPFAISQSLMDSSIGITQVVRENLVRFFDPFDHRGPIYLYTYAIFQLAAPWSVFLPAALFQMHFNSNEKSDRFTLVYFWAVFLFFTFSGSRRDYYLLPILPAAAILIARLFSTPKEALNSVARKLMVLGFMGMSLGVLIVGILALLPPTMRFGILRTLPELPEPVIFAGFWTVQVAAFIFAFFDLSPLRIGLSMGIASYLNFLFMFVFVLPAGEIYRSERAFAQAVRTRLKGDMSQLVFYNTSGPGLVFYLSAKEPIPLYQDSQSLAMRLESRPDSWVILKEEDLLRFPLRGSVLERERDLYKGNAAEERRSRVLYRPQLGSQ